MFPDPRPQSPLPPGDPGAGPGDERGSQAVIGRFAPSPSGPLHRGSIVAALGSWLDARAARGRWLLRIEDIDPPRERPGAAQQIARQLEALGLTWDGPILHQSQRDRAYGRALDRLARAGLLYGCRCTRRDAAHWPRSAASGEAIYPGTCRERGLLDPLGWAGAATRRLAIRWRLPDEAVPFVDRRLGPQRQLPAREAGDPVLRRADGLWGYQLAVVVDDADSAITDVVRGLDLLPGTGRQILLQRALALPTPRYLHLPLVVDASGRKLSKHEGAAAAGLDDPLATLMDAGRLLGIDGASRAVRRSDSGRADSDQANSDRAESDRADSDRPDPGRPDAGRPGRDNGARPCRARDDWLAQAITAWRRRYPNP